jgi:hypothetical protein
MIFTPYGFYVGYHFMKDTTHARKEAQSQIEYKLVTERYKRHDPRKLVIEHANQVVSHWHYPHEDFEGAIFIENALR